MALYRIALDRKVADGPVFNRRRPAIEPPTRYIIAPPFTPFWGSSHNTIITAFMIVSVPEVSAEGILKGRQPNFDNRQGTVGGAPPRISVFCFDRGFMMCWPELGRNLPVSRFGSSPFGGATRIRTTSVESRRLGSPEEQCAGQLGCADCSQTCPTGNRSQLISLRLVCARLADRDHFLDAGRIFEEEPVAGPTCPMRRDVCSAAPL